jgi:tetratricopeptide (TPR) repeat protein
MPTPSTQQPEDSLARTAEALAQRWVSDPQRRRERLGEVFLVCAQIAHEQPEAYAAAQRRGDLEEFLAPTVRTRLRAEQPDRTRGGWLGTYVDESGRHIEDDAPDTTDRSALDLSARALERAFSMAHAEGNDTLLRNLRWYRERLAHRSYEAIAASEERVPATVRTGVARARKFVLRIVHELQFAQPAPLSGQAPAELEPLRRLWFEQKLDALERELDHTRDLFEDDPHWLNLAALVAADRGRPSEAVRLYECGLVQADAPPVRGRLLNNLGNLYDDTGCPDEARIYWLRAQQLVPASPAPLLNLLGSASQARDYASAQHYVAELAHLLNSGRLTSEERSYVHRRLLENPKLGWLRETDVWTQGPARWLRSTSSRRDAVARCALLATLGALLFTLALLAPRAATAAPRASEPTLSSTPTLLLASNPAPWLDAKSKRRGRGGDSMGTPAKRYAPVKTFAGGDSMGLRQKGKRGKRGG